MTTNKFTLKKKLLYSSVSLIIFLLIVELTLRGIIVLIFLINPNNSSLIPYDAYESYSSEYVTKLNPNYEEKNPDGTVNMKINSLGFRGAEFEIIKTSDIKRIVIAGDSTVFGMTPETCPYPYQVQQNFNDFQKSKIEVINGGIEGNNSQIVLKRIEKQILPIKPDLILLAVGWNDLYSNNPLNNNESKSYRTSWRYLNKSYITKGVRRLIFRYIKPNLAKIKPISIDEKKSLVESYNKYLPAEYIENMEQIIEIGKKKNIQIVLMTMPTILSKNMSESAIKTAHYPYYTSDPELLTILAERYNVTIRELSQKYAMPLIESANHFDSIENKEQYFFDTMHMYCNGYELLGKYVSDELIRQNIL